jgi:hypothetical protein
MSSTSIKELLDITLSSIQHNKIRLQNIVTRNIWKEHVVCFYKLDCQRTFKLRKNEHDLLSGDHHQQF